MNALTFAVVLVGALGVLNLLLTFGVIRRLRVDNGSRPPGGAMQPGPLMAPVGTTILGTAIGWDGETLVGFFSPGCTPCEEQLPEFVEYAQTRDRVVAVVFDPAGNGTETARKLRQVAQVVVEDSTAGEMHKAFSAKEFPIYCLVRDGVIVSVAGRAADLAEQVARIPA